MNGAGLFLKFRASLYGPVRREENGFKKFFSCYCCLVAISLELVCLFFPVGEKNWLASYFIRQETKVAFFGNMTHYLFLLMDFGQGSCCIVSLVIYLLCIYVVKMKFSSCKSNSAALILHKALIFCFLSSSSVCQSWSLTLLGSAL